MNPKSPQGPASTRARCPVCRQPVYSRAGIHPQCAMKQADAAPPKSDVPAPLVIAVVDVPTEVVG